MIQLLLPDIFSLDMIELPVIAVVNFLDFSSAVLPASCQLGVGVSVCSTVCSLPILAVQCFFHCFLLLPLIFLSFDSLPLFFLSLVSH